VKEAVAEIIRDPLALWTAVIGTLTLMAVWLNLRISHRTAQGNAPHIVAKIEGPQRRRRIQFCIDGPNKDNWKVEKAALKWWSKNQFCRPIIEQDEYGEEIQIGAEPQGRSIRSPSSPLILAELPASSFDVFFTISLKSDPKIKRRCAARIDAIA